MSFIAPQFVTPYPFWNQFTPTLPTLYWDVDSHEERIKRICLELHKLVEYSNYLGENINLDHATIEELQKAFQDFIDGEYDQYYKDVIYNWIQDNFAELISDGVRQVYFGLTDDGHFCAYVPSSWSEITFDTGAVFGRSDYGRLILRFEADPAASGVIDNTYNTGSYSLNHVASQLMQQIEQLIVDMEINSNRTDYAYNTLFTNLDEVVSDGNF